MQVSYTTFSIQKQCHSSPKLFAWKLYGRRIDEYMCTSPAHDRGLPFVYTSPTHDIILHMSIKVSGSLTEPTTFVVAVAFRMGAAVIKWVLASARFNYNGNNVIITIRRRQFPAGCTR